MKGLEQRCLAPGKKRGGSHKMKCFRQRTVGATQKDRYSSDCFVYCKGIKLMQCGCPHTYIDMHTDVKITEEMFIKRCSFAWAKNQLTMRKVMHVNTQQTKLPLLKQQQQKTSVLDRCQ